MSAGAAPAPSELRVPGLGYSTRYSTVLYPVPCTHLNLLIFWSSRPLRKLKVITPSREIRDSVTAMPLSPLLLPPLLLLLLRATPTTPLKPLADQTFAAPFTEYNSAGTRLISSYRDGGHAKVRVISLLSTSFSTFSPLSLSFSLALFLPRFH